MGQGVGCASSFGRVEDEHASEQVECGFVHRCEVLAFQLEAEGFVVAVYLVVLAAFEERLAHQQNMEDSSQGKDVADGLNVLRLRKLDDLRGDVARSAASEEEILLDVGVGGKSEVHDYWLERFSSQHDVLWFQVAVHHSALVDVLQPAQQSSYDLLHLVVAEVALPFLD